MMMSAASSGTGPARCMRSSALSPLYELGDQVDRVGIDAAVVEYGEDAWVAKCSEAAGFAIESLPRVQRFEVRVADSLDGDISAE